MRFTARGVRETERPVSFIPKGALTHHLRSKRWYCLRQPCALRGGCGFRSISYCWKHYGQCHISGSMLSLSTQSAVVSTPKTTANCLRKPVTDSFIADMDGYMPPIFFLRKRNKNRGRKDGENEWRSTTWKRKL